MTRQVARTSKADTDPSNPTLRSETTAVSAPTAVRLASWAQAFQPSADDLSVASRSLADTVAVTLAARLDPILHVAEGLTEAGRWAVAGHILDFDDLHMESTTHVSAVCVPAVLATGGDHRAYLAAAGVMARLGARLGWTHYQAGWHATCTAGAPAAAVAASISMGLDAAQVATAISLSVPAAGGVQRAFGSDAKSLQVAFAVESGLRAAKLAAAGARADDGALDAWLELVRSRDDYDIDVSLSSPAIPGGLAIKIYPCCYALQRPISAMAAVKNQVAAADVARVTVRTPESSVAPLIHHRPQTGLQGKFSLEYAVAAALLDHHQGFDSFTDAAVQRPEAQRLVHAVQVEVTPGGNWLLEGRFEADIETFSGDVIRCSQQYPPGSPNVPPEPDQMATKIADCIQDLDVAPETWTWSGAAAALRTHLGTADPQMAATDPTSSRT